MASTVLIASPEVMSPADWIQLAIAIFTAGAAIAAWLSASASRESVNEQRRAGEQAAAQAASGAAALAEQIKALSVQAKAADEHARTAKQQAQAEAIRWSMQAHLDIITQGSRAGGNVAFDRMRGPVAAAEFALFRVGLLPRDFFAPAILRHLEDTFFSTGWLNKKRYGDSPVVILSNYAPVSTNGCDAAEFTNLWKAINEAINEAINNKHVDISGGLTDQGKSTLAEAALAAFNKQCPPQENP